MVPINLLGYFEKAEEAFGIPGWFLAALALKESSFNPEAENPSGAYGLFQLMPAIQKQEVDRLINNHSHLLPQAFLDKYKNSTKDEAYYKNAVSDPYINTLCGALHLISKGMDPSAIDWKSSKWKEQTLPYLASYGGYYGGVPKNLWGQYGITSEDEAKSLDKMNKWAKEVYVSSIWENAENFATRTIISPTTNAPITAVFGQKGKYWANGHTGIDFGVPTGTSVFAVANAEVIFTGWNGSYGNCVIISNGFYNFLYGHLSTISTSVGSKVSAGQTLGRSGDTGNSSGPHLHFEVRDIRGTCIDPMIFLK